MKRLFISLSLLAAFSLQSQILDIRRGGEGSTNIAATATNAIAYQGGHGTNLTLWPHDSTNDVALRVEGDTIMTDLDVINSIEVKNLFADAINITNNLNYLGMMRSNVIRVEEFHQPRTTLATASTRYYRDRYFTNIALALSYCTNGGNITYEFGEGTWNIPTAATNGLSLPDIRNYPLVIDDAENVVLKGRGIDKTTLHASTQGGLLALYRCDNVTLMDMTISGDISDVDRNESYALVASMGTNINCKIINCKIGPSLDHGFSTTFDNSSDTNWYIFNNTFYGCGSHTGTGSPATDGTAIGNPARFAYIANNTFISNRACVEFQWDAGESSDWDNISVIGNRFQDSRYTSIWVSGSDPGTTISNLLILNNQFYYTAAGYATNISGTGPAAIKLSSVNGGVIANNSFKNMKADVISVGGGRVHDLLIQGNIIQNVNDTLNAAPFQGCGIIVYPGTNVLYKPYNITIKDNILRDIWGRGILVGGSNIVVSGNFIQDMGVRGIENYGIGIWLRNQANYVTNINVWIHDNTIVDTKGRTEWGIYTGFVPGSDLFTDRNIYIYNNNMIGTVDVPIYLATNYQHYLWNNFTNTSPEQYIENMAQVIRPTIDTNYYLILDDWGTNGVGIGNDITARTAEDYFIAANDDKTFFRSANQDFYWKNTSGDIMYLNVSGLFPAHPSDLMDLGSTALEWEKIHVRYPVYGAHVTTPSSTGVIQLNTNVFEDAVLSGDITFVTTNRAAGKLKHIYFDPFFVDALAADVVITADSNWQLIGDWDYINGTMTLVPTNNNSAALTILCYGTGEDDIVAIAHRGGETVVPATEDQPVSQGTNFVLNFDIQSQYVNVTNNVHIVHATNQLIAHEKIAGFNFWTGETNWLLTVSDNITATNGLPVLMNSNSWYRLSAIHTGLSWDETNTIIGVAEF